MKQFATMGATQGELVIMGGRPSIGKTALASHMARKTSGLGLLTAYFALEPIWIEPRGCLMIEAESGMTIGQLSKSIDNLARSQGVRLFFVDHLQKIRPDGDTQYKNSKGASRVILHALKELAHSSGITIVLLTNIRRPIRKNYNGPILSDLDAYCPFAKNEADTILLLDRPYLRGVEDDDGVGKDTIVIRCFRNNKGNWEDDRLVFRLWCLNEHLFE